MPTSDCSHSAPNAVVSVGDAEAPRRVSSDAHEHVAWFADSGWRRGPLNRLWEARPVLSRAINQGKAFALVVVGITRWRVSH